MIIKEVILNEFPSKSIDKAFLDSLFGTSFKGFDQYGVWAVMIRDSTQGSVWSFSNFFRI